MFRSRLLWKLYASYVALILLTAGVVGFLVAHHLEQESLRETEETLRMQAFLLRRLFASALETIPDPGLEQRVREVGSELKVRITLVQSDGKVLADSHEEAEKMEDHAARPEIREARERGLGKSVRFSHTLGFNMMYVALPVQGQDRVLGFLRVALPLKDISKRLAQIRNTVLLGAGLAIAVGALLAFVLARQITLPLLEVTRAAEAMADGEYQIEAPSERKDEIGKLTRAVHRMAEHLRGRMDTITKERNQVLAILGGMVEGVIAVDREGRVVHMNEVGGNLLQVSPRESLGKKIQEVTQIPLVVEMLTGGSLTSEVSQELRFSGLSKDRIIEVRGSPLRDAKGELAGSVIVLHDITELRRLEQVRRDFVASVSHELKTPLTAIRGLVETLIDDPDMPAETHRRFLVKARDQASRLSNLVTDLLTLSRVESEEAVVEKEIIDFREIVRDSARALGPAVEAKGLILETHLPPARVEVEGDREALRQIVDNLLDNAIKYTARGGQVWLRIQTENNAALLEVEDTGCGIEPQHLDRIFERFYRVDKARSRELGGTGLGLSIVKHFVLAHRGQVSVESVPGKGSIFRVRLPLTLAK